MAQPGPSHGGVWALFWGEPVIWQEISIRAPHEYVEPISYLFSRYGHGLAMEPDGPGHVILRTYLTTTSRQRRARIEVGIKLVNALEDMGELTYTPLESGDDWENAWKSHFTLLEVGQRLVIKPSWIQHEANPDQVVVELDPGMAFGTGYHPTTYGCLEALEQLLQPGMAVLDLGTGSGILTITAVHLGADRVVALDIDPQAVRAARQNFRRSRIQQKVSLAQGSLPHPLAKPAQFDLVLANISQRAICERAPFLAPALKPGGFVVASGFLQTQAPDVVNALNELGMAVIEEWPREDWVTLVLQEPQV